LLTNASQPLAKGNRDRGCHALANFDSSSVIR
jgi:hypothetical protein